MFTPRGPFLYIGNHEEEEEEEEDPKRSTDPYSSRVKVKM